MVKMKFMITALSLLFVGSVAFAAKKNDFCEKDYQRAMHGDKNLVGVELEGAMFDGVNLSGVNFTGAELDRASFVGADLTNANFTNAELDEANLKGAKIKGAIFNNTELEYTIWVDGRVCAEESVDGCW